MDTRTAPVRQRLANLRLVMQAHATAAVLVPSADPHLSEYLPERWQGRVRFSGFTGSMGTLVVTSTEAAVFADSRYWAQAEAELAGSGIDLVKIPTGASSHPIDWLCTHLARGEVVSVDRAGPGPGRGQATGRGLGSARHRAAHDCRSARPGLA